MILKYVHILCCMPKKLKYKMGQDFLDEQYTVQMGSGTTSPENGSLNGTRRGSLQSQLTASLPAPGMPNYPKEMQSTFH